MGYGTRTFWNGTIKTFWPDDTENEFYLEYSKSLQDILDQCKEKWGEDISFEDIEISPEKIHTDCLGYDQYDSCDYTDFLHITRRTK